MKKSLSTFILALLATVSAWAQTFTVDNLKYEVTDGTAKTVKVSGYGTEPEGILEIPATVSYNGTDYGVTGIGYLAFNRCSKLTEVTIPNSVDNLETYAFSFCSGLTKVTLLGSVTNIGSSVFQSNTSLKQVTIGDGVTQIGEKMFAYCTSLTEVTIPNSITSIGNRAFLECNTLTTVTIGENVTSIGEYAFSKCSITEVVIPDNVTNIGKGAFQAMPALTQVTIGKSVSSIGDYAFNGCPNIAEMTVKAEVPPTLGLGALTGISYTIPIYVPEKSLNAYKAANTWKDFSNLQKILFIVNNLKYSITDESNKTVEVIGYVTVPEGKVEIPATVNFNGADYSVTQIGNNAFYQCHEITELIIGKNVSSIGEYGFYDCRNIEKMTVHAITPPTVGTSGLASIPTNIPVIYVYKEAMEAYKVANEWKRFSNLEAISLITDNLKYNITDESSKTVEVIGYVTVPEGKVEIPATVNFNGTEYKVTGIDNNVFRECNKITEVIIGENVTSIGEYAFWKCSITEVVIPDNVTNIGKAAFQTMPTLTRVIIGKSVRNIGENAFNDCPNVAEMTVMAEVPPTLGLGALTGISYTTPIYVPAKAFNDYKAADTWKDFSKLQKISFTVDNLKYSVTDESSKTVEVVGYEAEPEGKLQIPATVNINGIEYKVTGIDNNAFTECNKITEVIIGENVTRIGDNAFNGCPNIAEMTIMATVPPTVGVDAFTASLSSMVYVPVKAVNDYKVADTWKNFSKLKAIPFIVENLKYSITDADSKTVELIGYETEPEGKLEIPATVNYNGTDYSVTEIYNNVFNRCNKLTEVIIGKNVTSIGNNAFNQCDKLTEVIIGENVTRIGEFAFWNCSAITEIEIPNNVTDIEKAAFQKASALTRVTIGKSVSSIGDNAFNGCPNIVEMTVMAVEPPTVGDGALTEISLSTSVYVPAEAFDNYKAANVWKEIKNLKAIPFTVDNLKYSITDTRYKIVELIGYETKPEGKLEIPATVNHNDTDYSVTRIGDKAFYGCDMITEMNVKAIVPPAVGKDAFENVSLDIPVYVRAEALGSYKIAEGWRDFTNLKAIGSTAINAVSLPESISVNNGTLHNPQGLAVSIYDLKGRLIYSGKATNISMPAGMYVVRCAGANSKVMF